MGEKLEERPVGGSSVSRFAPAQSGRSYEIAIDDGLVDVYGQRLAGTAASPSRPARSASSLASKVSGVAGSNPRFEIPQWVIDAEAVTSVRVQLYRVRPDDFFAYQSYEAGKRALPPGTPVVDHSYAVGTHQAGNPRRSSPRAGGVRQRTRRRRRHRDPGPPAPVRAVRARKVAWLQVTRLTVSARVDGEKLSGWVQDITPAKLLAPVPGATAALVVERRPGAAASAVSDGVGHVTFDLPLPSKSERERRRARRSVRCRRAPRGDSRRRLDFRRPRRLAGAIRTESALWYVTDDRFTYKPGRGSTSKDGCAGPTMA